MPIELPKTIQSHDEVAENLRPLYVQVEGQPGFQFKDISGLQSAYVKQKETNQTLTMQLAQATDAAKAFEGLDIVKVKDLMTKEDEIRRNAANQPAEIAQFKTQLEQTFRGQVTAAQTQANGYKSMIESSVRQEAVKQALIAMGVREERMSQASTLMLDKISVVWDPTTNTARAAILKSDGMVMLNPATGDEMKPADIAAQFRKDIPEWFQATAGNGGGSTGQNTPVPTDGDPRKWSPSQQRAYAKVHGEAALQQRIIDAAKPTKAA